MKDNECTHLNFGFSSGFSLSKQQQGEKREIKQLEAQLWREIKTKSLLVNQREDPCGQAELDLRATSCFTPSIDPGNLSKFQCSNTFHDQWPNSCVSLYFKYCK